MTQIVPTPPRAPTIVSVPPNASLKPIAVTEPPAPLLETHGDRGKQGGMRRGMLVVSCASLMVAASALLVLVDEPRELEVVSGRAQPRVTNEGVPQRWHGDRATVVFDRSLEKLGPWAEEQVAQAFGTWAEAHDHLPRFQFDSKSKVPISLSPDGENRVYFAPIDIADHEDDVAITLSFSDERTGAIVEADIIVNARHAFADLLAGDEPAARDREDRDDDDRDDDDGRRHRDDGGDRARADHSDEAKKDCERAYDLRSIVTHEVGHFLGLGEDREDPEATMYYRATRCATQQRDLSDEDQASIATLYTSAPSTGEVSTARTAGCAVMPPRTSRDSWLSAGLALALFGAARRLNGRVRASSRAGTNVPARARCTRRRA